MRTNTARWLYSTIAGLACVEHLNPVKSTFAWKKNCSRLQIVKNACTARVLRSRQIRSSTEPVADHHQARAWQGQRQAVVGLLDGSVVGRAMILERRHWRAPPPTARRAVGRSVVPGSRPRSARAASPNHHRIGSALRFGEPKNRNGKRIWRRKRPAMPHSFLAFPVFLRRSPP